MKIQITAPSGVTLLTEKTYCPENIDVIPSLQEKSVTPGEAQTVTPDTGYAGLSDVNVEAVDTEPGAATPSAAAQVITPSAGKFFDQFTVAATPTETKTATAGTSATTVTPTSGKFLTSVTVNPTPSEEKTVEITSSGNTVITPSSGKLFSKVTVSPMLESYTVAAEATEKVVTPTDGYAGLSSVTIVAAPLQDITITQATDIVQEFTNPDPGYYGFGKITVPQLTGEEKSVTITENGTTTVNYSDPKLMSKVTITTNVPSITDVATATEMNAKLVAGNVGKVFRFTGTTDSTYTNGDLYEVVSE